jgi:hypothetical protein
MQHDGRFDGTFSRCARAGQRTRATCVNHRLSPRYHGDWFNPLNLESACASCNAQHARDTGLHADPSANAAKNDYENDWNIG